MPKQKPIKLMKLNSKEFAMLGGTWAKLDPPKGKPTRRNRSKKVKFWADLVTVDLGVDKEGKPISQASIGLCMVEDRNPATDPLEWHEGPAEGVLPLGESIILFLAKAGVADSPKREDIMAFLVPGDTIVSLPKGTWHWAPLPYEEYVEQVYVVVILPPKTYCTDCTVRELNLGLSVRRG